MALKNSIQAWIVKLCLISFFVSTIYPSPSSYEDKEKRRVKIATILVSSVLGFCIMSWGYIFSVLGKNHEQDIPVTPEDRHFFVIRNFLPKEELERILKLDQKIAAHEIKVGKWLLSLGALTIIGGIIGANFGDIVGLITNSKDSNL